MSIQAGFWNIFWLVLLAFAAYRGLKRLMRYDKNNQAKLANAPPGERSIASKIIEFLFKERESLKPLHRHVTQETLRNINKDIQTGYQVPEIRPGKQPIRVSGNWTESTKTEWRDPDGGKTYGSD
jgi:hypothetical protein